MGRRVKKNGVAGRCFSNNVSVGGKGKLWTVDSYAKREHG